MPVKTLDGLPHPWAHSLQRHAATAWWHALLYDAFQHLSSELTLHPGSDVQRHAARAYWHLVATSASRKQFLAADGVGALLHLSRMATKSVQGKSLAQQALKRLADDPQVGRDRCGPIKH